jgi:hypothetical protein
MDIARILTCKEPWAHMLQRGVILWRKCSFSTADDSPIIRTEDIKFEMTRTGSYFARIELCGMGMWEPEIVSNKNGDIFSRGIGLFVNSLPPENWTHLVIAGVSKAFQTGGKPKNGGCVFANVAIPYEQDDYIDFRFRMYRAHREGMNAAIEQAMIISNQCWPANAKQDERRLIVMPAWMEDCHYKYGVIEK